MGMAKGNRGRRRSRGRWQANKNTTTTKSYNGRKRGKRRRAKGRSRACWRALHVVVARVAAPRCLLSPDCGSFWRNFNVTQTLSARSTINSNKIASNQLNKNKKNSNTKVLFLFDVFYTCLSLTLSLDLSLIVYICVRVCVCVLVVFVFVAASRRGTAPSVAFELRSSTEQRLCLCCHCCCCCCCCFGSGTGFGFGSWPRLQLHFGLDPSSNANVSMNLIVNTSMCVTHSTARHGTAELNWTESSAARTPFFGTHAHAITYAVGHPPPLPFNCVLGHPKQLLLLLPVKFAIVAWQIRIRIIVQLLNLDYLSQLPNPSSYREHSLTIYCIFTFNRKIFYFL